MRLDEPNPAPRARLTALLRSALVAAVCLAILPLTAAYAAEPTPTAAAVPGDHDDDESPEPTATPEPTPEPTAVPAPYAINLYRSSTVVRQYKNTWCVPAATQSMWNLIGRTSNTSYSRQKALYSKIRAHNRYRYKTKGNDVQGWAWALRKYAGMPYQWYAYTSKTSAIKAIARAIDATKHPVGITVHHGTHAWVVLGYKASADKRTILGFYVHGPLGPGSNDPWKYRYISMASFRKVYGYYHERTRKVIWEHKYVLVTDAPAKG
jgi:peptidase C39-like protein